MGLFNDEAQIVSLGLNPTQGNIVAKKLVLEEEALQVTPGGRG